MKKFVLGLLIFVFALLSLLYLAVNSPYLVDKIARKYAPEYGFDYELITGNPLKGIILTNLTYKKKPLAKKVRIRINPYTLLEKQVTVSRLEVLDVNVPVLETMIGDFSAPSGEPESEAEESGGGGLPVSIQLENIRLSLLPFERYGVQVKKEELSVDSIHYANDSFSVGKLHQIADTSLGRVELAGTYHKRFLDVEYLAVDELNLPKLEKLIAAIAPKESENASPQDQQKQGEGNATKQERTDGEDPFLPKRIRAKRIWASLLPYEPAEGVRLEWTQVEGHDLDIDLSQNRVEEGKLTVDLQSNLVQARLKLRVKKGSFILENGVLEELDLQKILALGGDGTSETETGVAKEKSSEAKEEALDTIPFVPRTVEVRQLRVELKPDEFEQVPYRAAVAKVKDLTLDLHDERLLAKRIQLYLDTPLAHADLIASIDPKALRIESLELIEIDPLAIQKWQESLPKSDENSTGEKVAKEKEVANHGKSDNNGTKRAGISIPFLPSTVVLEKGLVDVKPFQLDPLQAKETKLLVEKLSFDLKRALAESGTLKIRSASNFADLYLLGTIRDNRLILDPKSNEILLPKGLFERYGVPLKQEAFSPIVVQGSLDEKGARIEASFHAKNILAENNESNSTLRVDIDRSKLTLDFDFASGRFQVIEDTRVTTPQTPLHLHAKLHGDEEGEIRYEGALESPGVKLGDPKIEKLLGKPSIRFQGDLHSVLAKLDAGIFAGSFRSDDLKKGMLKLQSKRELQLARIVKLPKELQASKLRFETRTPIDFEKPLPLDTNVTIRSNIASTDGWIRYDGNLSSEMDIRFPKGTLLAKAAPKPNLAALNPLKITLDQRSSEWVLGLQSKKISAQVDYDLSDEKLSGSLKLAGNKITIEGSPKSTILAKLQSRSVKTLIKSLTEIYKLEPPKLDGDLDLTLRIEQMKHATLELKSKQFVPDDSARIKSPIKNIDLLIGADLPKKTLIVQRYNLEVSGMRIFAKKPSHIVMEKDRIVLKDLWVNDSLKATGQYDLKTKKGEFIAKTPDFKIVHENAKIDASIDIKAKVVNDQVDVTGKIVLLGGNVMYNLEAKHYATDDDIVIVQHQKKNDESFFKKNVQIMIYIETKKPLVFKQKNVYVELNPQLSILKSTNGDLQVLGSVRIPKGGYYTFQDKRFVLQESSVNFTGKPTQPLLDINLEYHRFSKTIYITVNGMATEPNLNFSSDPYMTRSQILSFILFDTEDAGEDAGDMMTMVGGGIAKSILGNMGLKVDTLILTSEGFEVGKKLTDKITILYDQKSNEPKAILRIQHSKRTETDISIGSESQSVDIIYKREF